MKRKAIKAEKREVLGRKVKKLRREGFVPANLYGKEIKSESLQIKSDEFKKLWQDAGETSLIDVDLNGKLHPVLIHNVQIHPVSGLPLHVDFHQVSLTEKTTAKVPIALAGISPAVEQNLGVLIQPLSEVVVEALPEDLPEELTVDISGLAEIDQSVTIADIKVNEKIKILVEPTELVAKINPLAKEEEIVPPPVAEGEVPAEGVPEGEVPVEGGEGGEQAPVEGGEQKSEGSK